MYQNTRTGSIRWIDSKSEFIQIRVTEEEKATIETLAKLQHLSVSSFIRWLVLSKYYNDFIR